MIHYFLLNITLKLKGDHPKFLPIIFKLNNEIKGVEAGCAKRLAEELGRPLEFVELY